MQFAECLRAGFRHDPDIIMVGEIRDEETAQMAVRAALSGHLVFSSLHTGSALGAFTALAQFGVSPYLVGAAMVGVISQQLVRRICSDCKESFEFSPECLEPRERREFEIALRGEAKPAVALGTGCSSCRDTGYRGRAGIFEILEVTSAIRRREPSELTNIRHRWSAWNSTWESAMST